MHPFQENINIAAFLGKLWKMVNDPSTDHLISWNEAGNSFIIHNQAQFWYELLPLYYKHNNMSSFVRQLNFYGFHKITSLENSSLTAAQQSEHQNLQFYHLHFQKGKPEKLKEIKRKATKPTEVHQNLIRPDDLTKVLIDVKQLRERQSSVDSQISAIKEENAVLWRELVILRQKHTKQQQIVNKVIQFLVTLVQPNTPPKRGVGAKRPMSLMLHKNSQEKTTAKRNSRQHTDRKPTSHKLDLATKLFPEQLLHETSSRDNTFLIQTLSSPYLQRRIEPTPANQIAFPIFSNHSEAAINWPQQNELSFWEERDFASQDDEITKSKKMIILAKKNGETEKVLLNLNSRDAHLRNLMSTRATNAGASAKAFGTTKKQVGGPVLQSNIKVAKKNLSEKINTSTPGTNGFGTDLDLHVDTMQTELDQLKDILNGCSTFDPATLLKFLSVNDTQHESKNTVHDKENFTDEEERFPELFDHEDLNNEWSSLDADVILTPLNFGLNTSIIVKREPYFPNRGE